MTNFVQDSVRLSDHFTVAEATSSYVADRFGIDNRLPLYLLDNAKMIAEEVLEPTRQYFHNIPFSPLSWYRTPELCNKIGSSIRSQHTEALAVDMRISGFSVQSVAQYIYDYIEYDQLILEFYNPSNPNTGWVHVSRKFTNNRNQFLVYDGKTYKDGTTTGILRTPGTSIVLRKGVITEEPFSWNNKE